MELEQSAVPLRVRDQQDQSIDAVIALLQRELPIERLHIAQSGLSFDRDELIEANDGVPRPPVTRDRKRYLSLDRNVGGQDSSQPAEERKLSSVEGGVTIRNRARDQP